MFGRGMQRGGPAAAKFLKQGTGLLQGAQALSHMATGAQHVQLELTDKPNATDQVEADAERTVFEGRGNRADVHRTQAPVGAQQGGATEHEDPVETGAEESDIDEEDLEAGQEQSAPEAERGHNSNPNPESNDEMLAFWQNKIDDITKELDAAKKKQAAMWWQIWRIIDKPGIQKDIDHYEADLVNFEAAKNQVLTLIQQQSDARADIVQEIKENVTALVEGLRTGDDSQRETAQMFSKSLAIAEANNSDFLTVMLDEIAGENLALNRHMAALRESLEKTSKLMEEERAARVKLETQLKTQKIEHDAQIQELNDKFEASLVAQSEAQEERHKTEMQAQKVGYDAQIQELNKKIEEQGERMQAQEKRHKTEMQNLKVEIMKEVRENQQRPAAPAAKKQGVDRTATNEQDVVRDLDILNQPMPDFDARESGCFAGLDAVEIHSDSEDEELYKAAKRKSHLSETALARGSAATVREADKNGAPEAAKVVVDNSRPVAGSISH
jgi:hypothetical protein